jgi:hypothetical protein
LSEELQFTCTRAQCFKKSRGPRAGTTCMCQAGAWQSGAPGHPGRIGGPPSSPIPDFVTSTKSIQSQQPGTAPFHARPTLRGSRAGSHRALPPLCPRTSPGVKKQAGKKVPRSISCQVVEGPLPALFTKIKIKWMARGESKIINSLIDTIDSLPTQRTALKARRSAAYASHVELPTLSQSCLPS